MNDFAELTQSQLRLEAMLDELGEDGMILGELDGFLCGVAVSPVVIPPADFLPLVWGGEAFDVPALDQGELVEAILARYAQLGVELAEERYEPLYEIDEVDGEVDVLWEVWIGGFEAARSLSFAAWEKLLQSRKESLAQEAAFDIMALMAASDPEMSEADSRDPQMIRLREEAPNMIPGIAVTLYRAHRLTAPQMPIRKDAVGRNDPCPCGSGLKYKRCHGA